MTADLKSDDWLVIFAGSPVNGGPYIGEYLPVQHWDFPKSTWFQSRLEQTRKSEPTGPYSASGILPGESVENAGAHKLATGRGPHTTGWKDGEGCRSSNQLSPFGQPKIRKEHTDEPTN